MVAGKILGDELADGPRSGSRMGKTSGLAQKFEGASGKKS